MPLVIGWAWQLMKPIALKLLLGLAIAGAVGAVLLRVKHAGRMAERVKQMEAANEAAVERTKTDAAVSGMSDDDLSDWLRPPAKRRRRR